MSKRSELTAQRVDCWKLDAIAHAISSVIWHRSVIGFMSGTGFALALLTAPSLQGATFTVSNTADAGPGSLRDAVNNANQNPGPDEILFASDVSGTIHLESEGFEIQDSLAISGSTPSRITVDGGDIPSIFSIPVYPALDQTRLELSRLTLTGSEIAINAPQIVDGDFELLLQDCTITESSKHGIRAESVYNSSGMVEIKNSIISGSGESAIKMAGDQYHRNPLYLTIENSRLSDNPGSGMEGHFARIEIRDSKIDHNAVGIDMLGGKYLSNVIRIDRSLIAGNSGSGIVIGDTSLQMKDSSVRDNLGSGILFEEPWYEGNGYPKSEISSSTVSGNGHNGVDISWSNASVLITNSTISGHASGVGVHLAGNYYDVTQANIRHTTIVGNALGGIDNERLAGHPANVPIEESIVAGNGNGPDLTGNGTFKMRYSLVRDPGAARIQETVIDSNIFGRNPRLGPLQDNGGPTMTHALRAGSPAIDHGDPGFAPPPDTDQRGPGYSRVYSGRIDMGAFEFQPAAPPFGAIQINDQWETLCPSALPADAVVLLGPPTYHDADPGVVRLARNAQTDCPRQVRFQEWDYRALVFGDLEHPPERVSFLGLVPGIYPMPDGSLWEVGRFVHQGTGIWKSVAFQSGFAGKPLLFLTAQTANGDSAISVRARNVTRNGFQAALFEEESLMDGHSREELGYLAIYHPGLTAPLPLQGRATIKGTRVDYSLDRRMVNQNWTILDTIGLKLEEEQSFDPEVLHPRESVDILKLGDQIFAQQVSSANNDTTAIRRK